MAADLRVSSRADCRAWLESTLLDLEARELLDVQRLSHDCAIGDQRFQQLQAPAVCNTQRAAALRFGDRRVLALLQALVLFRLQPEGFRNAQLREHYAHLLGLDPANITQGQMTYQLRRLKLHGLIERTPRTHRYQLTDDGLRTALFLSRLYARTLRPGLALLDPQADAERARRAGRAGDGDGRAVHVEHAVHAHHRHQLPDFFGIVGNQLIQGLRHRLGAGVTHCLLGPFLLFLASTQGREGDSFHYGGQGQAGCQQ